MWQPRVWGRRAREARGGGRLPGGRPRPRFHVPRTLPNFIPPSAPVLSPKDWDNYLDLSESSKGLARSERRVHSRWGAAPAGAAPCCAAAPCCPTCRRRRARPRPAAQSWTPPLPAPLAPSRRSRPTTPARAMRLCTTPAVSRGGGSSPLATASRVCSPPWQPGALCVPSICRRLMPSLPLPPHPPLARRPRHGAHPRRPLLHPCPAPGARLHCNIALWPCCRCCCR